MKWPWRGRGDLEAFPRTANAGEYWSRGFELMLEESRRSIDRQSERVQTVRERAVALVGFGSLVAAAFGFSIGERGLGAAGWVGSGAFVFVAASSLWVLYPREFKFELSARQIETWMHDPKTKGVQHMVASLATRHDEHHAFNHAKLRRLQGAIALGVLALSIETVALVSRLMVY